MNKTLDKTKNSGLNAAILTAAELRQTAERIERAVNLQDFEALSEIFVSRNVWTVDEIRGFFLALVRTSTP